ncbi:hypothetical protein [Oricola sp.]|uniref:hypothetical protein n=1 Tax=Oricola sp. TaxID=1979950 RepID=UPI0025EF3371|nr:hypothetical protein [Oricola sp.]MCI5078373.1 hypothetical protein [Oricola sp.]
MADTSMSGRPTIAFGPSSDAPSWDWVGVRTARALEGTFNVTLFDDFASIPDASIIVMVKTQPPRAFVEAALARGIKLVYLPIDRYHGAEDIAADAWLLGACSLVLSHSRALLPWLEPHARHVGFIEHEAIHALEPLADYRLEGFVLWVGGCEHLPHVVAWLQANDIGAEVTLLTNDRSKTARVQAHLRAHALGLRLEFGDGTVNGHRLATWSEEAQERLMRSCRAAIDIKGTDFNQATKPPTKAQQFIASGIPFACNADSSIADYLTWRGFDVADVQDPDRLFSRDYFDETRTFAPKLRRWTSANAVGETYRDAFESLLAMPAHPEA